MQGQDNVLSAKEKEAGWNLLFDGNSLLGWAHRGGAALWVIDGGLLIGSAQGRAPSYIGTYGEFTNFELSVDFNQDSGHNSGIFIRGPREKEARVNQYSFYEINIADTHSSGYTTGSLVSLTKIQPAPQTEGKWNTISIIAEGRDIKVTLNGIETVNIQNSSHYSGVVVLQAFGKGKIRFKNIKIRELE